MKNYVLLAIVGLFLFACSETNSNNKSNNEGDAKNADTISSVSIKDFDSLAPAMVGKTVMVTGLVDHVCKHGGKKLMLVDDDAHLKVMGKERFNDSLKGNEVSVIGLVKEFKLDEEYCEHADEDNEKALKEGKKTQEQFDHAKEHIKGYRDSMKTAGVDHLSFYSIEFVSFKK